MKRSRKWRSAIGAILLCAVLAVTPMTTWADDAQPTTGNVETGTVNASGSGDGTSTSTEENGTSQDSQVLALSETGENQNANSDVQNDANSKLEIYVSAKGSKTGDGTANNPYASLAQAVDQAPNGATIYVMSNLTMSHCAYVNNKNLIITSGENGPYTITRDEEFDTQNDPARRWYNPAMIEGAGTGSLTISNLILDDQGHHTALDGDGMQGSHYVQASSDEAGETVINGKKVNNRDIVQDAIIATYSKNFTITLGEGCELKNFGGMSAVRVADGNLVMQGNSQIYDDLEGGVTRTKQTGDNGYAGAVWIQSGTFTLEQGASIYHTGRAVYSDGKDSKITINGKIYDITPDSDSWQSGEGAAIHLRNESEGTLNGVIEKINTGNATKDHQKNTVYVENSNFDMSKDAEINTEGQYIRAIGTGGNQGVTLNINGTVTGVLNAQVFNINIADATHPETIPVLNPVKVTLGSDCHVVHNSATNIIYMQTIGGTLDIYGHIDDNFHSGDGIWMCHNNGVSTLTLHDGATISRNNTTASTFYAEKCTFNMQGGSIDHNVSTKGTAGISTDSGCVFIMTGGSITDNVTAGDHGTVCYGASKASIWNANAEGSPNAYFYPRIELQGGTISGNLKNAKVVDPGDGKAYEYSEGVPTGLEVYSRGDDGKGNYGTKYSQTGLSNYYDNHVTNLTDKTSNYYYNYLPSESDFGPNYITMSKAFNIDVSSVAMRQNDFTISGVEGIQFGNTAHENEIAATDAFKDEKLTDVKGSFWYKTSDASREVSISGLDYDTSKPLYAAIMATGENGKAAENPVVTLRAVETNEDGSITLDLPGQSATGYAVVFLQQAPKTDAAKIVTVTPADVTVYQGGKGYTAVVDGNGKNPTSNTMPHPLFKIDGVDDASGLTFSNGDGKSWTVVSDGKDYYHFVPGTGQDNVRVTYTNAAGDTVTSDDFDVSTAGDTFEQFTIGLYLGDNNLAHIIAKNDSNEEYAVALGTGTLTVRAIQSSSPDAVVSPIEKDAPTTPLKSGTALAVEPEGTEYTLNNTGVKLPDDAQPSLLFDDIIASEGIDRESALKAKVDEQLGGANSARQYQMKYLDLVDANNSNAWIMSSVGTDIYWAYPEGTDENTDFTMLHFKNLHRDGDKSGYDVADINAAEIENVKIEKTAQGIKFHVASGNFSPYVLTWNTPSTTQQPGTTDDGGDQPTKPNTNKPDQQQTGTQTDQNQTKVPNTSATDAKNDTTNGILAATGDTIATAVVTLVAAGTVLLVGGYAIMKKRRQ